MPAPSGDRSPLFAPFSDEAGPTGGIPSLPDPIPVQADESAVSGSADHLQPAPIDPPFLSQIRSLRHGCYLLRLTPNFGFDPIPFHFDGTLRVQRDGFNTISSGDLYIHRSIGPVNDPGNPFANLIEPNPAAGITIFPIDRYRFYVRVTQILEASTTGNSFTLGFELHRFNPSGPNFTNLGSVTAQMSWTPAPIGYPSSSDYLEGDLKASNGAVIARITMGWVSPFLRRATVEIDRVQQSEAALDNGVGVNWQTAFDAAGWQITVDQSDSDLAEPSGQFWSDAEMHEAMLNRRDFNNLDKEWRYHLICVRRLDSTSRGIMYDAFGTDSNNVPREGAGIASHWTIPDTPTWGRVRGQRFGAAAEPYFRTAVHEIGHAQGLYHNTVDNGFMNTTGTIASSATLPEQFPDNVRWAHAPDDQKRLRHMPDIWVRPGGIPFGQSFSTVPISPDDEVEDTRALQVKVTPLLDTVPIGAPIRVDFSLANVTKQAQPVPASLSMKAGHVSGKVIGPNGGARTFRPLLRCIEEHELEDLGANQSKSHSITLLRGADGALFPAPGIHRVIVDVEWDVGGRAYRASGETSLMITPPVDDAHAKAALKVLTTPDSLLTLVIGGDHLDEGIEAIQACLDNKTLAPHYAIVEARRLGKRHGKRVPDIKKACGYLKKDAVMSASELRRAAQLIKGTKSTNKEVKAAAGVVKSKLSYLQADAATKKLIDSL